MMIEQSHHSTTHTVHATEGHHHVSPRTSGEAEGGTTEQEKNHSTDQAAQDQLTLSPEAKAVVAELKARDMEVKAHEQAHMAAGAGLTSGASYSYQTGPDGQRYAVGGEVQIDTGTVAGNPEATIAKAEQVRKAALAPANPSAQDMSVAASATQTIATAQAELTAERSEAAQSGENEVQHSDADSTTKPETAATKQTDSTGLRNPEVNEGQQRLYAAMGLSHTTEQGSMLNLFA